MPPQDQPANPTTLGLMVFGMTTILLSLMNLNVVDATLEGSLLLPMAIFSGGIVQLIAGGMAFKRGEMFAATAFSAYGSFWEVLAFYWLLRTIGIATSASSRALASFMIVWGMFSFFMWILTFKHSWNLVFVFGTLWLTFFLLAAHAIRGAEVLLRWAGYFGLVCGILAMWAAFCAIFFDHTGKELPGSGRPL
ncbi:MAG: acetate uptake transporter [Candidatus Hadarchaeales archaeon]